MTWLNPPPVVLQMRTQLLACSSLTAAPLNMVAGNFHYPTVNPSGNGDITPDDLPAMTITDEEVDRIRYAEGAIALIKGKIICTLYVATAQMGDVGQLEQTARQVLIDLAGQYFGITFESMRVRLASNLSPGQEAASNDTTQSAYRSIQLHFSYGLNRSR